MKTFSKVKTSMTKYWFWAWLVIVTFKIGSKRGNPKCLVWENLIIVSGENGKDAYAKAMEIGCQQESQQNDTVRLDGKSARTKFLGIADMGFVHDHFEDGGELYYKEARSFLSTARGKVASKKRIVGQLTRELAPYIRIKWNPHAPTERKRKQKT